MTGRHRDMKFAGRLGAVAVAMAMLASPAWAQTVGSQQPAPLETEKSMKAIVAAEADQGHAYHLQPQTPLPGTSGSQRPKRPKSTRAVVAARVALGGFLGGGYLGAKLTPDCLRGFFIGAPIGAVAGGLLGWKLSGR